MTATYGRTPKLGYEGNLRLHVLPKLGGIKLQEVTAPTLTKLYGELREGDEALSPRTVRYVHTIVHRAFKDAIKWNRVVRNPAAAAEPPSLRASRGRKMSTWSAEELKRFLATVADDRLHAA
jgi:hypothetical protein